ncbi:MAG: hypothetical protein CMJ85_10745 [Planctomycetes bacterium]|jgi:hypothetical protein|nr:hypothetical protein [Planctomycetota bacterium]
MHKSCFLTLSLLALLVSGQDRPARQDLPATAQQPKKPKLQDLDKVLAPYLTDGMLGRLQVAAKLMGMSEDDLANRVLPRLTGERNRLILEVRSLIENLGDVRYLVRERSETALINRGPEILPILKSMLGQDDLEVGIRLDRVIKKLGQMDTGDIQRKALIARGIAEALGYRPGEIETHALVSALESLDGRIRLAAIRSLAMQLSNQARATKFGERVFERIVGDVKRQDLSLRNAIVTTLGAMPTDRARDFLSGLVANVKRPVSIRLLALRVLRPRLNAKQLGELAASLKDAPHSQSVIAAARFFAVAPQAMPMGSSEILLSLKDDSKMRTSILGTTGSDMLFQTSAEFPGIETLRIPRAAIDRIETPATEPAAPAKGIHVLLKSGTRIAVQNASFDGKVMSGKALGRDVRLPRQLLSGLLPDPTRGRALGGSRQHDQVRVVGERKPIEGRITSFDAKGIVLRGKDDKERKLTTAQVEAVLFRLKTGSGTVGDPGDVNQYVQIDLRGGERIVGYLLELNGNAISLASKALGCFALPLHDVASMRLSNSGRALTGFTLVTDYGDSRVVEYDGEGREVWKLEDLFDPLDAELTPAGTILVTEQGDNAVREYDREGNVVWEFTDVTRPIDADRLANGNTLITDPGNFRVIEVDAKGKIVWDFGRKNVQKPEFKPYDADRLPNGNTLISDYLGEQVLEVSPAMKVVWRFGGAKFVCDADRLPNGNTLITMRQPARLIEITPAHVIVWEKRKLHEKDLQLPWDADRLPDGTTMVAENYGVRVYNKEGKVVRTFKSEWASEANSY